MQEYNRLLYVALTRAEDRLVICGWDTRHGLKDESWYRLIQRGFATLGATPDPATTLSWEGEVLALSSPQEVAPSPSPDDPRHRSRTAPTLGRPARPVATCPTPARTSPGRPPLAPSRPGDVAFGPIPGAASPRRNKRDAFQRGNLAHALLQHLPRPPGDRLGRRRHHLPGPPPPRSRDAAALSAQTLAVLRHPDLAPLFALGSRAEQPLTGLVGQTVISGTVDRMAVLPDRVLLVDYKTGRDAPPDVTDTPILYLRQLARLPGRPARRISGPRHRVRARLDRRPDHRAAPVRPAGRACAPRLIGPVGSSI